MGVCNKDVWEGVSGNVCVIHRTKLTLQNWSYAIPCDVYITGCYISVYVCVGRSGVYNSIIVHVLYCELSLLLFA